MGILIIGLAIAIGLYIAVRLAFRYFFPRTADDLQGVGLRGRHYLF